MLSFWVASSWLRWCTAQLAMAVLPVLCCLLGAFTAMPSKESSTLSLATDVFVSLIAFLLFRRAKYFDWSLTWPFISGSVPMAFLGGSMKLSDHLHQCILGVVLLYAGITLLAKEPPESTELVPASIPWRVAAGAGIGLCSGMVGVGGGIFLSPLIILLKWGDVKKTVTISAIFIFLNSMREEDLRGL